MTECSKYQSKTPAQTGNIALFSFKNSSFQTLPELETQMLLLLLKQCLQEQARYVYGTTLWLPSCQMSKLCSDTCSVLHQDLPRVTRERGSSDVDTRVGELPSQPQTHWNFTWEGDSERTKPSEMLV